MKGGLTEPAGRALDLRVAREVMNLKPCTFNVEARYSAWMTAWTCACGRGTATCYPSNADALEHSHSPLARYSEDTAASFPVVERMRRAGFSFKFFQSSGEDVESSVSFVCAAGPCEKHGNLRQNHHGAYEVPGSSFAHAVCLAALEAFVK